MMYLDERGRKKFDDRKVESLLRNRNILKVLPILKREKVSELVDYEANTLLHLSAKYNNQEVINYLIRDKDLDVNFYVNAVNSFNETPLMILVHYNNDVNTLKFLLDAGADLWKIKNNTRRSALAMIILKYNFYNNNTSILELVMAELEKRCSNIVEVADVLLSAGCQPYHLKMYKKAEITKLLIERGCPVNLRNPEDGYNTALHVAAEINDVENVKVLLQSGADQYIENNILTRLISLRDIDALDCIIHHLVLIEVRGSRISTIILNQIEADTFTKNCFKKCKRELDDMKTEKISCNVTYYDFLIDKDQKILRYVKNEEIVKVLSKCESKSYFHQLLIERFEKALEAKRWRTIAGQLIKECIESLNGYDLIIEMILDFLECSDWKLMASTD